MLLRIFLGKLIESTPQTRFANRQRDQPYRRDQEHYPNVEDYQI